MADASLKVASTTQVTHVSSGAALAAAAFSASTDVAADMTSTNTARYPRADVALTFTPSNTTSSTSMNVYLYRRDLNVGDAASDDPPPTTSYKNKFMGAFQVSATTSGTYTVTLTDVPLPSPFDCQFFIENQLTNGINAGWTLKITPKTDVGATT